MPAPSPLVMGVISGSYPAGSSPGSLAVNGDPGSPYHAARFIGGDDKEGAA